MLCTNHQYTVLTVFFLVGIMALEKWMSALFHVEVGAMGRKAKQDNGCRVLEDLIQRVSLGR